MRRTKDVNKANQDILYALLKDEPNKRCFDCQSRGPTYVNVTALTFVVRARPAVQLTSCLQCTSCSGMLRDFGQRIKSISASLFTAEEIHALKMSRGNLAATRICMYLTLCID